MAVLGYLFLGLASINPPYPYFMLGQGAAMEVLAKKDLGPRWLFPVDTIMTLRHYCTTRVVTLEDHAAVTDNLRLGRYLLEALTITPQKSR